MFRYAKIGLCAAVIVIAWGLISGQTTVDELLAKARTSTLGADGKPGVVGEIPDDVEDVGEIGGDVARDVAQGVAKGSGGAGGGGGTQGPTSAKGAPAPPPAREARAMLERIKVAPEGSMSGYSREKFRHWSDAEDFGWNVPESAGAGCDVRDAALLRDGQDVVAEGRCSIKRGSWLDPYTGRTYTKPSDIDIDHVVALANAWRSGASKGSAEAREKYANDPRVLLSAEDDANQAKGDKGPEAWKPANKAYHCEYSRRWIWVKHDWNLSVNPAEKTALEEMLATCGKR